MFELNRESMEIDTAKITKLIVNFDDNTANIEYQIGYMKNNEFHRIGTETLFIQDKPEKKDNDNVIQEKITDFTDFYAELNGDKDPKTICLNMLMEKGIAK